eukprot:gene5282-6575_t
MSVFSFGLGVSGALGHDDTEDQIYPKKIDFFTTINKRVKKISCGSYHTVFVTDDEELYICGLSKDPKIGTTLFVGIENSLLEQVQELNISSPPPPPQLQQQQHLHQQSQIPLISIPEENEESSTPPLSTTPTSPQKIPRIPHNLSTRNLLSGSQTEVKVVEPPSQSSPSTSSPTLKDKPALPIRSQIQIEQIMLESSSTTTTTTTTTAMTLTPSTSTSSISSLSKSPPQIITSSSSPNLSSMPSTGDFNSLTCSQLRQISEDPPKSLPVRIPTGFLDRSTPANIIKQVALGNYHIVLLTEGGNVWTWGSNSNGQLGYPENPYVPKMVELKCVRSIAAGVKHTAAINEWGELYMWGINEHGELGLGDTKDRKTPTRVSKLKSEFVTMVACSSTHSVCCTDSERMYLWGQSDRTGKIQTIPTLLPIQSSLEGQADGGGTGGGGKIRQVVCGEWQVAALTQMGEVFVWNVGGVPVPIHHLLDRHSIRTIAMGNFHLICLTDNGEVITLGRNKSGQLGRVVPQGNNGNLPGIVKQLAKKDTVNNSGNPNGNGKSSDIDECLSSDEFVVSIAAGEYHSVALVENTVKTKVALQLLRMQRNYLRQLNILSKLYYKSLMSVAVPYDISSISVLSPNGVSTNSTSTAGDRNSTGSSSATGGGNNLLSAPTPITASSSTSSPGLISGSGTISRSRSTSMATIRGFFGLNYSAISALNEENVVTEEEVQGIFSDINELVKSTEKFLNRLDQRMDQWDPEKKLLGDLFLDEGILSSYRVYIPFSDNYNTACMTLFNIKKRSERFVNILKECEKKSQNYGIKLDQEFVKEIDLKSLLLAPLQNIPRIYIMLKELSLNTIPNHKDLDLLNQSAGKFQCLLERMNQNFQFVDAVEILNCSSNEYGNPQIMGGSLNQLVDKLTHHNISDPNFRDVFLLTFRAFTTPLNLMDLLIETHEKQPAIKNSRAVTVMTTWVVQHFYDFENDSLTMDGPNHQPQKLSEKIEKFMIDNSSHHQISLIKTQYYAQRKRDASSRRNSINIPLPSTSPSICLLDIPVTDISHTMTYLDHAYFSKIDKREFLGQRWTKNKSPNIQNYTEHFNRISQIIVSEIVKTKNPKQRSSCLAHFISVAYSCYELNNLCGVASIIYGLNSSPVTRLKKTWSKLTKESFQSFEFLDKIVTPMKNYISLRHLMTTVQPPCIPFLGIYLKDLTFIEDGNPSIIGGLINFYKQRKIAEVIFQIQQYQQVTYPHLHVNTNVKDFLLASPVLDEKQAQKLSVEIE